MALPRPDDLFDRVPEWEDLSAFASAGGEGLRVAVVHGRREEDPPDLGD